MAPYRGVSRPVITFALERLMDKAAAAFGIDPVEIRRRNLIDKFPYKTAMGLEYRRSHLQADAGDGRRSRRRSGLSHSGRKRRARKGRYLGIGFATFSERTGYGSPAFAARGMEITPGWETVIVTVDPSGFVEARIGSSPHGQGLRTTLAQIIADEIGVTPRHDQGGARRHRPRALRLGHVRQPFSGDLRRRHADRRAQGARQADQDRQPYAGSGAGRHRAGGRRAPRSPAPTAPSPSPRWRARPTRRRIASRARSSPA